MTLTVAQATAKTTAINDAFAAIGLTAPDTKMPRSPNNREPVAWEVLTSCLLVQLGERRKTAAIKAAITAGVMFDHKKTPRAAETDKLVYDGDVVRIDLHVGTGSAGIDHDAFVAGLLKGGVKLALIDRLHRECATKTADPHKFTPSIVTA